MTTIPDTPAPGAAPRHALLFALLGALTLLLFVVDIAVGDIDLPLSTVASALLGGGSPTERAVVVDIRLIKAVVALIAGVALSVSGLQMQVLFRNPLAGPYVLGISSGASLGVALFILGAPLAAGGALLPASIGVAGAAWIGSAVMLAVVTAVGARFRDIMIVLILGMLFSSGVGALVQVLQYLSHENALKAFVIWSMGSLSDVTPVQLAVMVPAVVAGLLLAVATVKPLNLLLFGQEYAVTMGLHLRRSRLLIFLSTTLLAGTVTAFCGPLGFIGMAMPHVARFIFRSADNRVMLPAATLTGAGVMLLCDIVSKFFIIPVNAITALAGIPVVVWIVMRSNSFSAR